MILAKPHHILATTHEVISGHKVKRIDNRGVHWIEKHPEQICRVGNLLAIDKALAVKKQMPMLMLSGLSMVVHRH